MGEPVALEARGRTEHVEVAGQRVALLRGRVPSVFDPEYIEFQHYEGGQAERDAASVEGLNAEPWLNVLERYEPGVPEALEAILSDRDWGARVRGRVVDLGAGTCWAAARLSQVGAVDEVFAVDLSPVFLSTVGARVFECKRGEADKLRLVASNFENTGLDSGSCDAVFLIAALHHALAPVKVIMEVRRILSPGGSLFVVETPASILGIERRRRDGLAEWKRSRCAEIAYTRRQLEYVVSCGGMEVVTTKPLSGFSKSPWKRIMRWALRRTDLEHVFLPAMYLFVARPTATEHS